MINPIIDERIAWYGRLRRAAVAASAVALSLAVATWPDILSIACTSLLLSIVVFWVWGGGNALTHLILIVEKRNQMTDQEEIPGERRWLFDGGRAILVRLITIDRDWAVVAMEGRDRFTGMSYEPFSIKLEEWERLEPVREGEK